MIARLSQLALVVALVFATSGLARAAAVIAADDCCEGCEHSDCPEKSSDEGSEGPEGCPLPCSECVCAAYIAPAIVAAAPVFVASSAGPALQPLAPDVHPEARFLPGVFRPPRSLA